MGFFLRKIAEEGDKASKARANLAFDAGKGALLGGLATAGGLGALDVGHGIGTIIGTTADAYRLIDDDDIPGKAGERAAAKREARMFDRAADWAVKHEARKRAAKYLIPAGALAGLAIGAGKAAKHRMKKSED